MKAAKILLFLTLILCLFNKATSKITVGGWSTQFSVNGQAVSWGYSDLINSDGRNLATIAGVATHSVLIEKMGSNSNCNSRVNGNGYLNKNANLSPEEGKRKCGGI